MYKILLIDDDLQFCDLTSRYLTIEGFMIEIANNDQEGLRKLKETSFDLVLLDIMFPEQCGFDILNKIRQQSFIPIIMYSALDEDINEIIGLETGADGYVKKSSHPRVLTAKVHSVLRRANDEHQDNVNSVIVVNSLEINRKKRLAHLSNKLLDLTQTEFNILEFLLINMGNVKTKKELSLHVLGKELGPHDRAFDTHISRLRSKLDEGGTLIQTIQGVGYKVNSHDTA